MIAIGIIIGISISILLIVIETYLIARRRGIVEEVVKKTESQVKQKGAILPVKDDVQIAREQTIDRNERTGGTKLEDLDL